MATAVASPPAEQGAEKAKKKSLLPAIIVAVALLGAAYMMKGGNAAPAAAGAAVTSTTAEEGSVVPLDPITVNLADGRFLKVGLGIQLSKTAKAAAEGETPQAQMAKALDEAISIFGHSTYQQLLDPAGRDKVKEELSKRVRERYEGEVLGVYFTEFVMQ
jgi:flagellar FliL protein